MNKNVFKKLFLVRPNSVRPVFVRKSTQNGKTIWRDRTGGMMYQDRQLKEFADLTAEERRKVAKYMYELEVADIYFVASKDPSMKSEVKRLLGKAEEKYQSRLKEI